MYLRESRVAHGGCLKNLSSPRFVKLHITFTPINEILADSILLACWNISQGLFRVVTFSEKSHFSPPLIWLRVPMVKYVLGCVCILEIVYFLSFYVYLYLFFRRICVFSSVSGFTWPPSSGSPHQLALNRGLAVNLDRVR